MDEPALLVDEMVARSDRCFDAGEFEDAARGYERCRELFAEAGNPRGEAYVLHRLAQVAARNGRLSEAKRLAVEAIDRHRRRGAPIGVADVTYLLADIERQLGNVDGARELFRQAASLFRAIGETGGAVGVLTGLGEFEASFGRPRAAAARAAYDEALAVAREADLVDRIPTLLVSFADLCRMAGELDEARRLDLEAEGLAAQTDSFEALADASRGRAMLAWAEDDLSAAWEAIVQAIRAYESQPNVGMQVESTTLRGDIELARGDLDSATRTFASADRLAVAASYQQGRARALAGLGRAAAARGDLSDAVRHLERALGLSRALKLPIYEATVLADLGLARRRIEPSSGEATLREALHQLEALGLTDDVRWLQEEMGKP